MKKYRLKVKNLIILIIMIISLILLYIFIFNKSKDNIDYNKFVGKKFNNSDFVDFNILYEYNDNIKKDVIISINDNNVFVSKGIDPIRYSEYKVNELGKVPIMMYHGIVNTKETNYIGGNVDKEGYNRTSYAFRNDLEFYYSNNYRFIRLIDYINGVIDVELGFSPIVLTFDDGNKNNFNVLGIDNDGELIIDPDCAVGIMESFKKKYNINVTATFFIHSALFNQNEYNEKIIDWLIDHGYDIGNHTLDHNNLNDVSSRDYPKVIGSMYKRLDELTDSRYVNIIALPFGNPTSRSNKNFDYIISGEYEGFNYYSDGVLRVGWESNESSFSKDFDKHFIKRCRAYDNNGVDFDIEMVFKKLENNRYISDGDKNIVVIPKSMEKNINIDYNYIVY